MPPAPGLDLPPVVAGMATMTTPTEDSKRWDERYSFTVGPKQFSIQFVPVVYQAGYSDAQLDALAAAEVYAVTFALEPFTRADGAVVAGFGVLGTGQPFQVLGGVGNGIVEWTQRHRPDYLHWIAVERKRQRLYDRMICYFARHRGSGWRRLEADPFTGRACPSEVFWLARD